MKIIKNWINGLIILFYFYAFVAADKRVLFLHYHLNFVPGDVATDSRYAMFGLVVVAVIGVILWIWVKIKKQKEVGLETNDLLLSIIISIFLMIISKPIIKWNWILLSVFTLIVGLFLVAKTVNIFLKIKGFWWKSLPTIFVSTPFLILFHSLEMVGKIKTPAITIYLICVLTLVLNFLGNLMIGFLFKKRKVKIKFFDLFWVTITFVYVFLPLIHFIFMTPISTKYITNWDNFLAKNLWIQFLILVVHYLIIKVTNFDNKDKL